MPPAAFPILTYRTEHITELGKRAVDVWWYVMKSAGRRRCPLIGGSGQAKVK